MTLTSAAKRVSMWLAVMLVASLTPTVQGLGYAQPLAGDSATISGSVKFVGQVPTLPEIKLNYDSVPCQAKSVPDESLVVGPQRGIRYVVLTLEGSSSTRGGPTIRKAIHYLNCERCRFAPHVLAMSVGDSLVIRDYDSVYHSLLAMVPGGKTLANWSVNPAGMTTGSLRPTFVPKRPGIVGILCTLHGWMAAYVVVTDTPYYAVTNERGHYEISGIPPGRYVLKVWTERLGQQERNITLSPRVSAKADFAFSVSGKPR